MKLSEELTTTINELASSKNILISLVLKDLFGNYKNSALGFGWHFVMPALMMIVYYVAFTQSFSISMPDFWIYLGCALFPFNFMISNLTGSTGIIVGNSGMIKKMYFPREILVLAKVISSLIVLLIGYVVVVGALLISGFGLNLISALYLLPLILLMTTFVLGYSLALSALTVYVRDIQHILNSISVAFFFITPMYFTTTAISGAFSTIIWFNPFTYFIEGFHDCIYYGNMPCTPMILICLLLSIISFILGACIFNKLKRGFAERL